MEAEEPGSKDNVPSVERVPDAITERKYRWKRTIKPGTAIFEAPKSNGRP